MSFQPPSAKQEIQNRKILEELQKKQQALKQPNASTASNLTNLTSIKPASSAGAVGLNGMNKAQINPFDFNNKIDSSMAGNFITIPNLAQHSNGGHQREKAALQYALQNSFGNYISQDSSFGNQI